MRLRYPALIAVICTAIAAPSASAMAAELPLIPLEKSLLPSSPATFITTHAGESHEFANALVRGLLVANRTGEISYGAALSYKIQDVVRSLRRGESLRQAKNRSGVSDRVVARLLRLGHCEALN